MAPNAHSGFRDVLLNFGLIGLVVLFVVIVRAVRQGAALYYLAPKEGWLWLNLVIAWFVVTNLAESVMLVQNDFMFIIVATAILSFGLRTPGGRTPSGIVPRPR
jgi:exopolysaccharide production protein ExoQ